MYYVCGVRVSTYVIYDKSHVKFNRRTKLSYHVRMQGMNTIPHSSLEVAFVQELVCMKVCPNSTHYHLYERGTRIDENNKRLGRI